MTAATDKTISQQLAADGLSVVDTAELTRLRALEPQVSALENELEELRGPHCTNCGKFIDPEVCWCGDLLKGHGMNGIDSGVPMGCVCGYVEQNWQQRAGDLARLAWRQRKEIERLRADAELGALVRKMQPGTNLFRVSWPSNDNVAWEVDDEDDNNLLLGQGSTPETALRAALEARP